MLEITWSEISLYSLYLEILSVHGINVFCCKTYKRGRCLGQREEGKKAKKERREGKGRRREGKGRRKLREKTSCLKIFDLWSTLLKCMSPVIVISCVITLCKYMCIP